MTPQQLATTIRDTYFRRFGELPEEFQQHFASRLYSWDGDGRAAQKLAVLRPGFLPDGHDARLAMLRGIRTEWAAKDLSVVFNNYAVRKPYFEKYPDLLYLQLLLFRIRHWYCLYGVDERQLLFEIMPKPAVLELVQALRGDGETLKTLSTYAVNTLYLFEKLYPEDAGQLVDRERLLGLGRQYDLTDKKQLQLLLYLFTHCILGETLFYYQPVGRHSGTYRTMLQETEQIIAANYGSISLDNKFEFLVCARLCAFETAVAARIYAEAAQSLQPEQFLADTHNTHVHPHKQSFATSEHRNVLFIMSTGEPAYNQRPVTA